MSEEILKALTQLFAIVTKQDGGVTDRERLYVIHFFQTELDQDTVEEYVKLYDRYSGYGRENIDGKSRLTSVSDSVKTLGICKKINQTLTQKQKVVVLIKLLELVGPGLHLSLQRRDIINTVSSVFNLEQREYNAVVRFVIGDDPQFLDLKEILWVDDHTVSPCKSARHAHGHFSGALIFLHVPGVNMYFVKYLGAEANLLNSFIMEPHRVYLFTHGGIIRSQAGDALYYSDIVSHFQEGSQTARLSFNARLKTVRLPQGNFGLHEITISESAGTLVGIMGASGSGKTTLLNALAGLIKPQDGEVRINGLDLHEQADRLHGVIGYVLQDDLLIEELTIYENLYYNAKLCFANLTDEEVDRRVIEVLENLGLDQRRNLRVGNALDKVISGGQRKRLNIALELIREPAVLFLDEPTSGLSSRDSENVIDLLKELSLKGKLIFVVIHQPSSDIFKMFDKIIIMDAGGYPAYYGPPVEAITYFKKSSHQVDSNRGQCKACGNVNPEQIFNILEARVVDEYGQPTQKRKVTAQQWHQLFRERFTVNPLPDIPEPPPRTLHIPSRLRQTLIFTVRDTLAKLSNKQYLLVNLIEAPLLALLLAFVIRYNSSPDGTGYLFRYNENFPAFLLMSIIVALFMGLSVSAEEITRDRKILKRESFLHLSWNSYLQSKLAILFSLSALQTFTFVAIGHLLLEVEWKMLLPFWFTLFSVSCLGNVMGLNISSAFRSAVTVYIMIPLMLIPQMILSGLLFKFEKLNDVLGTRGKTPVIADLMASRWAYEAMAVYQFRHNSYEAPFYHFDKIASQANYKATYLADELNKRWEFIEKHQGDDRDSISQLVQKNLTLIQEAMRHERYREGFNASDLLTDWNPAGHGANKPSTMKPYLGGYKKYYQDIYNRAVVSRESLITTMETENGYDVTAQKNRYYNESLADLLTNVSEKNRIIEYEGKLVQQIDPIFQDPQPGHLLDYRAHLFAPQKNLLGARVSTYGFNMLVIWLMTLVLYCALYGKLLRKIVSSLGFRTRRARIAK